jgi:hypothetical protein
MTQWVCRIPNSRSGKSAVTEVLIFEYLLIQHFNVIHYALFVKKRLLNLRNIASLVTINRTIHVLGHLYQIHNNTR